ncbi:MerR family transcriptional regulator [Nocardioides zeae]|uniref:MerR family transcriptional regulator n=1 Tax=Nocardioides imazamoxiresistens TaxID=3231893 RepID=A0ABU3PUS5_9ACTN|nr:MerR family transcriptional regulator [Nocardioides zeae]MDT9592993.1 MerR family transcriptional regulator [Nocardioides zeae]
MRIGELAERAGASVRSLRYYEEQGLLTSQRSPSGQRHYDEYAVERVLLLKRLYAAGLTSSVITEVLPCTYAPSIETNDHAFERMTAERDRLAAHIAELTETLGSLDRVIAMNRRWRAEQDAGSNRRPDTATGA